MKSVLYHSENILYKEMFTFTNVYTCELNFILYIKNYLH